MYPIVLTIGSLNIYSHGLMVAIGSLLGGFLFYKLAKKRMLKTGLALDAILYSLLAGIIFARLSYIIIYRDQFSTFTEILQFWNGGLISFGGLIGGFFFAWLFLYLKKTKRTEMV